MAKSLLKHHCYCPMLLMRTTKTAVCLQTKAIFHHLYGFYCDRKNVRPVGISRRPLGVRKFDVSENYHHNSSNRTNWFVHEN